MERETLLRLFPTFLEPLANALDDPNAAIALVRALGYELPGPTAAFDQLGGAVDAIIDLLLDIEALPDDVEEAAYLELVARVALAAVEVIAAVRRVALAIDDDAALADLVANTDIVAELPGRLKDYLLSELLRRESPSTHAALSLLGFLEERRFDNAGDPHLATHVRRIVHWDRIPRVFSDTVGLLKEEYGWDAASIEHRLLLDRLLRAASALGVFAELDAPHAQAASALDAAAVDVAVGQDENAVVLRIPFLPGLAPIGCEIYPFFTAGGDADGFGIGVYLDPTGNLVIPVSDSWRAELTATTETAAGFGVLIRRHRDLEFITSAYAPGGASGLDAARLDVRLALVYEPEGGITLLGTRTATNLGAGALRFSLGVDRDTGGGADFAAEFGLGAGALVIQRGEADGFLQQLLPSDAIRMPFDLAVGFSTRRGLYFRGSAGLETTIGLHLDLGPVALELLHVRLAAAAEGVDTELSVTGAAEIGPITASVDRLGALAHLRFEGGSHGLADFSIAFKPPTGLGLAVDAGPVTGGGYISFDPDAGRYAGVLQLEMFGVGVTAIAVLDTKDSAGQRLPPPGFSFLMIITAEFQALQLGFGFTLTGVGGLVGIHRAMALERLRSGVRDGSLDHVMFPADPVRNMPQIISDLRAFFPATPRRYVFGPMARIGWGTPTLFTAEIGILLEVPSPVILALLGQLTVALPTEDADIVSLHVSILGVLDFGKKLLSIDASLYDSRVAAFAVYGDMAMRLSWGDTPSFALAVGGLNPHFQPPPEFPTLRRVTVSLGLGDNPRVGLQGYMAVTSNTVQFGALAEVYAAAGDLNVYGWLKFDALVTLSPFYFRFDFSTGFALRLNEEAIAGISIVGTLAGPSPYHISGEGCISILFVDVCIAFDVTVGERRQVELPATDPWPQLMQAIADTRSWSATLPAGVRAAVRVKEPTDPGLLLVHPMGSVTLRQRVLPLNIRLDKFGEFALLGATRYDVVGVEVGAQTPPDEPPYTLVQEFFAPGQFEELSNAEKLSESSFQKLDAGVSVGSARLARGKPESARVAEVRYETVLVDDPRDRGRPVDGPALTRAAQVAMSGRGAAAFSALRRTGAVKYADPRRPKLFTLDDEDYAIAGTADTGLRLEFGTGLSKAIARQILDAHLAAHPEDRERLQVVPLAEVESRP